MISSGSEDFGQGSVPKTVTTFCRGRLVSVGSRFQRRIAGVALTGCGAGAGVSAGRTGPAVCAAAGSRATASDKKIMARCIGRLRLGRSLRLADGGQRSMPSIGSRSPPSAVVIFSWRRRNECDEATFNGDKGVRHVAAADRHDPARLQRCRRPVHSGPRPSRPLRQRRGVQRRGRDGADPPDRGRCAGDGGPLQKLPTPQLALADR